ncbi:MAG: hypothetical protein IPJ30_21145 [Acidobacteria bacterium]|nr:hypothetical protein [Acidobacteriota bacterium]MBK8147036.1 hypothetical protein [Acidobacteriota bacterium]
MTKTAKELAFLRDLYVDTEWTLRFMELTDKHFKFKGDRSLLYINAGTGNHALEIGTKAGRDARIGAVCENKHLFKIARDKAIATRSRVDFSDKGFDEDSFDAVLADGSLVRPGDIREFVADAARYAETGGAVAVFLVSAGSFGEVFSILWEAMMDVDSEDLGLAERLISELASVSEIEEILADAGLEKVESHIATEIFEFENGPTFVDSPLVADFLMPMWFSGLTKKEIGRVRKRLARLIDDELGPITFRFTVKAVLAVGEKP